jgi:hypothetical protein
MALSIPTNTTSNGIEVTCDEINGKLRNYVALIDTSGVVISTLPVVIDGATASGGRLPVDISGMTLDLTNTSITISDLDITDREARQLGQVKISDAGIVIPTDKQAIYRHAEIDYTTPITGSGTYTSSAIDGLTLKRVTGTVYADQAGTLNIQESKDGTTYRTTVTQAITASTPYAFDAIFHSRYIRLNYVNGAVAQTVFELVAYSAAE